MRTKNSARQGTRVEIPEEDDEDGGVAVMHAVSEAEVGQWNDVKEEYTEGKWGKGFEISALLLWYWGGETQGAGFENPL